MVDYTSPITATFELQREAIKQSQKALEQGIEFQQEFSKAVVDGLEGQEGAQRRVLEMQRDALFTTLDTLEENVPGTEGATEEIRATVDEQFDQLLENYEEAFEEVTAELGEGVESYDEFALDYLEAVDDQLDMVIDAHEDLEAQSVEAAEQVTEQLEELQDQIDDVQAEIGDGDEA